MIARAPLTTRVRADFAAALKRASLERQLKGVFPQTVQDILEDGPGAVAPQQRLSAVKPARMSKPPEHRALTRSMERLIDASAAIRAEPPQRIDFLHTIQCQCGIPYKNPGDHVREWDRKQGGASLRIEAGSAIDPTTGEFVKLGLPYGEKPRWC